MISHLISLLIHLKKLLPYGKSNFEYHKGYLIVFSRKVTRNLQQDRSRVHDNIRDDLGKGEFSMTKGATPCRVSWERKGMKICIIPTKVWIN